MAITELTKYEQETIITFNADEKTAEIYTADPFWIKKLERLSAENPQNYKLKSRDDVSRSYIFPKRLITLRGKVRTLNFTEEHKNNLRQHIKDINEKHKEE